MLLIPSHLLHQVQILFMSESLSLLTVLLFTTLDQNISNCSSTPSMWFPQQFKILLAACSAASPESCANNWLGKENRASINPYVKKKFIAWVLAHAEKYCLTEEYMHLIFFYWYFPNVMKAANTTLQKWISPNLPA